jgi:MFS family permease
MNNHKGARMHLEQPAKPLRKTAEKPAIGSLLALFSASGVALLGNSVSAVALPWFVLATGGSATETGLAALMGALPLIIGALLGGTVVDRLGYRRAGVISDLFSFTGVALIPLLYATLGLPFWLLLVLIFFGALLDAPGATARQALLPSVARGAAMPLERANAIFETIEGLTMLAGPLLAGLLIAALGPLNAIWFNAATFLLSAGLTASVRLSGDRASARPARSYREEFVEGLRFIWHDRLIRTVIMLSAAFMALIAPLYSVILPVYVEQTRGSALDLGLLLSAQGGGGIIGALSYAAWGTRLPKRPLLIGSLLCLGLGYAAMASLPPWPLLLLAAFIQGITSGPINPLLNTVLQRRTPEDMRGRVLGLLTGLGLCAAPAGLLGAGLLLDAVGLQISLAVVAACVLAIGLCMPLLSSLRELDQ